MKNLILILLIALGLISVTAQTGGEKANQAAALQEAQKIGLEVVKLFREKKFDEALPLAQKVITIREGAQGKNHVQVASAWRNLGYVQLQRGKRGEAKDAFRRAVEIFEKNQSLTVQDERNLAEMLEAVALYEAFDGDFVGAEKKLKRAIEIGEKVNGKDALATADPTFKLAQIYLAKGEYENAAPLLLRALDIKTKKSGKLDDQQAEEIYGNAYCTLSKLKREGEQTKLVERFYPKNEDEKSDTGNQVRTINAGIVNGKALYLAKPPYPAAAKTVRASGAVNVHVKIDETGKVIFACALSGAKELQRASEIAAYESKFTPTTLGGNPVRVTGVIVYNYIP